MAEEVRLEDIAKMRDNFAGSPRYRVMQNAVARNDIQKVSMNWDRFATVSHNFSHVVTNELAVTAQSQSGRCWIFAALNALRLGLARKYKLEEFEFSQSYLFFWDKLEKANYFLESMIETAQEPQDGRLVMYLCETLFQDGGQWHMVVNLIEKYGLVPQSVYPDNEAALNSRHFNQIFKTKLREQGVQLRELARQGRDTAHEKGKMIEEIYRMLAMHMGTPPTEFDWEFKDREKKFHAYRGLTPYTFYKNHVGTELSEYVCLVHSPRKITPYHKTFTIKYLGNVIEGAPILYVNVPIEEMKAATIESLKNDEAVWMGCDVGKCFHRDVGVMDTELYDLELVYDVLFRSTKEERMNCGESQMTHAMLFTGVNLVDDAPTKWRVENSWGDKVGKKGYFLMTDPWFDEYMFEIAVHKRYLPKKIVKLLELDPYPLEPWDPLGSLAH